jgi:transposase-like protein
MGRKRYSAEQIIRMLSQAEVLSSEGRNVPEICRELGVTANTYYRWRKEYGGMQVNHAKRLKELEKENSRLKRAVADLTLDKLILKEASEGNF